MKILPALLLTFAAGLSLAHSEDAPKRPNAAAAGEGKGGKIKEMLLQKFDANKNGVLDPDEKAAAMKAYQERKGKSGGIPRAGAPSTESGSKFRRPPEAPKEGDAAKK